MQGKTNFGVILENTSTVANVNEIVGLSAIGYIPLWRVALTKDGIDVGMSTMQTGKFQYQSIVSSETGWVIEAQNQGVKLNLIITKAPAVCTMSKQWYPYASKLTVKKPGKAERVYYGTAIRNNQKPLPPHPTNSKEVLVSGGLKNKDVYSFIDMLKFCVMDNDFKTLSTKLVYPIRYNSNSANSVLNSEKKFCQQSKDLFSQEIKQAILSCKYDEIYKSGNSIGVAGGVIMLEVKSGKLTIATINKN